VQALKGVELKGQTLDVTVDRPLSDLGRQSKRGGNNKHRQLRGARGTRRSGDSLSQQRRR
jgi:hypothetical protein